MAQPNQINWWVAPITAQAEIAYRRLKTALPGGLARCNDTKMLQVFPNGSRIYYKTAEDPDTLYGEDVNRTVIDEASRTRPETFTACRSTATKTHGKFVIIGNVKGRKNWFFQKCREAEAGGKDMHYQKILAFDAIKAGILTDEEIEDAKRNLPVDAFNELYLAIPTENGANPFGVDKIRECLSIGFSNLPAKVYGIDLAKSRDWTVVIGIDQFGGVRSLDRWQKIPWPDTRQKILEIVGRTKTLVDSTGVGDPVVDELQKERPGVFEGFKFTGESKQLLMRGLAMAIQSRKVSFPEGVLSQELENFEYEYRGKTNGVFYSAPSGFFDDCVCALALAVHQLPKGATVWDRLW